MDRRDMLKSLGVAAAGSGRRRHDRRGAGGQRRRRPRARGLRRCPGTRRTPRSRAARTSARVPDDYFIPGRFAGKTFDRHRLRPRHGRRRRAPPRARRRERRGRRHPRGARRPDDRRHPGGGRSATFVPGDISAGRRLRRNGPRRRRDLRRHRRGDQQRGRDGRALPRRADRLRQPEGPRDGADRRGGRRLLATASSR